MKTFLTLGLWFGILFADGGMDTFGIVRFYPTKQGTREWNSLHWNNGKPRTITYAPDPDDPTGWTDDHSGATDGFRIDGMGVMEMSGGGPRFHVNSLLSSKVNAQKFRDVEFTAFYRRKGTAGQNYGGMVVGLRSGPLGHGSSGGNDCDATTYYGRFRNDGKWDFEKELKHPGSTYWSGSGFNKQDPLWNGAKLPLNRWIGMKYLCYNLENNAKAKLELYIDSVSNAKPQSGGHWEKVGEVIDDGNWPSGDVSGCAYTDTKIILDGGGTTLMRTDNDTADYTMVSIREIVVSPTGATLPITSQLSLLKQFRVHGNGIYQECKPSGSGLLAEKTRFTIFDVRGRPHFTGEISARFQRFTLPSGVYILQLNDGAGRCIQRMISLK
jgi:hypothetical protein